MAQRQLRRWLWALGPVALYAGAIILLSAQSELPSVGLLWKIRLAFERSPLGGWFGFDKIMHFAEYALLGVLVARAVQILAPPQTRSMQIWTITTCLGAAFGVTDEIHQYFVPSRDASVWDVAADTVGAATGAVVWLAIRSRFRSGAPLKTPIAESSER